MRDRKNAARCSVVSKRRAPRLRTKIGDVATAPASLGKSNVSWCSSLSSNAKKDVSSNSLGERCSDFTRRTVVPDFSPVITQAYVRILGRPPDAGGLESYNQRDELRANRGADARVASPEQTSTRSRTPTRCEPRPYLRKNARKRRRKSPPRKNRANARAACPAFGRSFATPTSRFCRREPDSGGLDALQPSHEPGHERSRHARSASS